MLRVGGYIVFQIMERKCKKDNISSKVLKIYEKLNEKFLNYDTYILKGSPTGS